MTSDLLARANSRHREYLLAIAFRMLGESADAQDVVQEAMVRYGAHLDRGGRPGTERALLTTITTRLAIDHLRSARVRREQYVGPWLPEPLVDEYSDPATSVADVASVSSAFLVLLERLTPEQRAVFLLHEVFAYRYDEIADIVGKSPAACRQLGARARRHIDSGRARFSGDRGQGDRLAVAFVRACTAGDLSGLLRLLAPEVTFVGDGGDSGRGFPRPIHGADRIARSLAGIGLRLAAAGCRFTTVHVGGQPALVLADADDAVLGVYALLIDGGRIIGINGTVNPRKLGHLGRPLSQVPKRSSAW